jgi:HK97 family phage major capsid protein
MYATKLMEPGDRAAEHPQFRFSRPELAKDFGAFCQKLYSGDKKSLTPLSGGEGGYLLPSPEIAAEIVRMAATVGIAARIGRPVPMGAGGFGQTRRLGGAIAYWKTSGAAGTPSSPTFGRLDMRPETLMALVDVDIELEQDSMADLGNYLAGEFAYALAYKEDQAAFIGDGSPTYGGITGILNSDRVTIVDMDAADEDFSDLTYADLVDMEAAVWEGGLDNAAWLFHRTVKALVKKLEDTAGHLIWQAGTLGEPPEIMGYRHYASGLMRGIAATDTETTFMAFGDFRSGLYIGRRGPVSIDYSPAPNWTNLQNSWRAYERVSIAVNGFTAAEIAAHPELANPISVLKTGAGT